MNGSQGSRGCAGFPERIHGIAGESNDDEDDGGRTRLITTTVEQPAQLPSILAEPHTDNRSDESTGASVYPMEIQASRGRSLCETTVLHAAGRNVGTKCSPLRYRL